MAEFLNSLVNEEEILEIRQIASDRLRASFKNPKAANKVIDMITKDKKLQTKAFIPTLYLTTVGILDNIPLDTNLNQLDKELTATAKIIKIERMKSTVNGVLKDLEKIKIYFRSYELPEEVRYKRAILRVRLFIPRPTFCRNCLSYGHFSTVCKNKNICPICTQENNENHACKIFCKFCKSNDHITNAGTCPEKIYQTKIKIKMIQDRSSFKEARMKVNMEMRQNSGSGKIMQGRGDTEDQASICEIYKKRLKELTRILQLLTKMAFSEEEEEHRILEHLRDTIDQNQELFITNREE
ncbi:hypothetical protein DMENIID0001_120530 [Sergentomyia squamirostris]